MANSWLRVVRLVVPNRRTRGPTRDLVSNDQCIGRLYGQSRQLVNYKCSLRAQSEAAACAVIPAEGPRRRKPAVKKTSFA